MILSMTGFGRTETNINDKTLIVEIKSLNGKQLDSNLKLATILRPYELEIRKKIQQSLIRGSVEASLYFTSQNEGISSKITVINEGVFRQYHAQLSSLAKELNLDASQILPTILSMPEVVTTDQSAITNDEWQFVIEQLAKTIEILNDYRLKEGESIKKEFKNRITSIINLLQQVDIPESLRMDRIRERLTKSMQELKDLDTNRLEQEMIYYIEKLDISEEKQRLSQHCNLFLSMLEDVNAEGIGKKMNFLLQEIGREVNTLGSKANDSDIQKIVVNMKDELEKCKEQAMNVL